MRCQEVSIEPASVKLAHLDIGTAVAQHFDALGPGRRMSRAIHHQISAEAANDVAHAPDPRLRRG